jgi:hypothetical protein
MSCKKHARIRVCKVLLLSPSNVASIARDLKKCLETQSNAAVSVPGPPPTETTLHLLQKGENHQHTWPAMCLPRHVLRYHEHVALRIRCILCWDAVPERNHQGTFASIADCSTCGVHPCQGQCAKGCHWSSYAQTRKQEEEVTCTHAHANFLRQAGEIRASSMASK